MSDKVFFAHGMESGPWGTKIVFMAEIARKLGFDVESPDYSETKNPDERVKKLLSLKPTAEGKLVLVGSSMGAWVSLEASQSIRPDGIFLLAPAVYIGEHYSQSAPTPHAKVIDLVHGWNDAAVPVENAIRYAREHQLRLHLLADGHRLVDQLSVVGTLFDSFLREIQSLG
ncbi:MAG: alpha/beta hydrolase [SAR324 cluster bacterium]|nr:alpha/beta hydrolase [SAR324 cluster bacterium]